MQTLGSAQFIVYVILAVLALGLQLFALVDAARHRADLFPATGNQTKALWLVITAVATAIGFLSLPFGLRVLNPLGFLNIIAVVAAAVYLTKVRPKIHQITGRGGGSSGGYSGGW